MPFAQTTAEHTQEYWTRHFEIFLKPIVEETGQFIAERSEALRGDIQKQIISDLITSPVVIADLTDKNPNVFWELGVRQSFKHGTITIAEYGTSLPFDISTKGTLFYYPKDHIRDQDFRKTLKRAILDCLTNAECTDSIVLDAMSGRGTLFQIFRKDEAVRRLNAVLSECSFAKLLIDRIVSQSKKNQKGKLRNFITNKFRCSAIELLITNRYIDEDNEFYCDAENILDWFFALNAELSHWRNAPETTEIWFVKHIGKGKELLKLFESKVKKSQNKLLSLR